MNFAIHNEKFAFLRLTNTEKRNAFGRTACIFEKRERIADFSLERRRRSGIAADSRIVTRTIVRLWQTSGECTSGNYSQFADIIRQERVHGTRFVCTRTRIPNYHYRCASMTTRCGSGR